MYCTMGYAHATLHHALRKTGTRVVRRLRTSDSGQGTVEYVGLLLLIAGIAGVVASKASSGSDIATTIVDKVKGAIEGVNPPDKK